MMIAFTMLLAAQSVSGDPSNLGPSTADAILAGARACYGSTIDASGMDGRLAGWTDATDAQKAGVKTDGRVVARDNVMLVYKPGVDGGCVVVAKPAAGFDRAGFATKLSGVVGQPVSADSGNPVTMLNNGEVLVVNVADKGDEGVQLVFANQNNSHVKHAQGK